MRYLGMVPVWGLFAAFLILHDGSTLFMSRWALNTVALTHMITLGILGNAMLGSLLQFLPVAAGVRLAPASPFNLQLPIIFNLALAGLLAGLLHWTWLIPWSGLLLVFSLVLVVLILMRGFGEVDQQDPTLRPLEAQTVTRSKTGEVTINGLPRGTGPGHSRRHPVRVFH